jgi:hypothetical protein
VRAYLRFRRDPALQQTLIGTIAAARSEAAELERQLLTGNAA